MHRIFLIGLVAVAVITAVAAVMLTGGGPLSGLMGKGANAERRIMVVTPTLLKDEVASIDANTLQAALAERDQNTSGARDAGGDADKSKPGPRNKVKEGPPKGGEPGSAPTPVYDAQKRSTGLKLVAGAMEDSLGHAVGERFQSSGRFQLVSNSSVIDAMQVYDSHYGRQEPRKQQSGNVFAKFMGSVSSSNGGSKASTTETADSPRYQQGLSRIAQKVNADLVMVLSIGNPSFGTAVVRSEDGSPPRIVMRAQPIVNCELFEVRRGGGAWRYSEILPQPVTESLVIENEAAPGARLLSTYNRLIDHLDRVVSQRVLAWALDTVAPARVIGLDGARVLINRGANDGLVAGAVLTVEHEQGPALREGDDVKGAGGRALESEALVVGKIHIDSVQKTIAQASMVPGGGQINKGDIVLFDMAEAPSPYTPATDAGSVPLGRAATLQASVSAGGAHQANVAIDDISVTMGGKTVDSAPMALALSEALQKDRRINVLPRADLYKVMAERRMNQRATDNYDNAPEVGLAASGYLIVGEFKVSTARHADTVSIGDVSRVVSTSTSQTMSGSLRANSMEGKLVASVHVTAGSGGLDGLAEAAARQLMLELFPMRVVQVGPAPDVLTLDRGADGGIKLGDRVHIYSRGKPVIDRESGAVLSEGVRTLVGDALVFDVEPGAGVSEAREVGPAFSAQEGYAAYLAGHDAVASPVAKARPARSSHRPSTAKPDAAASGAHW